MSIGQWPLVIVAMIFEIYLSIYTDLLLVQAVLDRHGDQHHLQRGSQRGPGHHGHPRHGQRGGAQGHRAAPGAGVSGDTSTI